MKLINQSHEILTEPDKLKLIELAGRVCYKSESRIGCTIPKTEFDPQTSCPDVCIINTEDINKNATRYTVNCIGNCPHHSASKFVSKIVRSGHWSVLEHASIAFEINEAIFYWIRKTMARVDLADNYVNDDSYLTLSNLDRFVVSGNFRAWKEFLSIPNVLMNDDLAGIGCWLAKEYPEIFSEIVKTDVMIEPLRENDLSKDERILHKRISVRLITNRSCSHELVRHRSSSFSQESTRFVKYNKPDIEFIKPDWGEFEEKKIPLLKPSSAEFRFLIALDEAESHYKKLLSLGWRAEMAREVLPLATKTEIVMTDSIRGWYKVMRLRLAKAAHPMIRDLMTGLLVDLIEIEPDVFGGLS